MQEKINLSPNPRVLQMLGQIEFENWQCVAELIDNSIDALLKDFQGGREVKGEIHINIPTFSQYQDGQPIVIWDNGPGMDIEQLENALKAGYSSNDPSSNLGLFGMGFNISTARLGDKTTVYTSKKGSLSEIGIEIDFNEMVQSNSFERPVLTKRKDNQYHSGTTIKIHKLKDRVSHLGQQGLSSLRKNLSCVYSKLLREYNIDILVNGDKLIPNKKCVWDPQRFVTRNNERIHAYIEIDEDFGDVYFCNSCWNWLEAPLMQEETPLCRICDTNEHVTVRDRKIKGWLGIQRYYDKETFGIDFYRNGRLIVSNDKTLFNWKNPATGELELEYPVDATHWGGRIVGEIEANFLKVAYTKDSIEKMDKHWDMTVKKLRGEGPIRPNIAANLGFTPSKAPIARLFTGYRKGNKPGYEDLLPGKFNEQKNKWEGNNTEPKYWAELFADGDPDYQDDHKWFELVLQVEENRRSSNSENPDSNGNPTSNAWDPTDPNFVGGEETSDPEDGNSSREEDDIPDEGSQPIGNGTGENNSSSDRETSCRKDLSLSGIYKVEELGEEGINLDVYIDDNFTSDKPIVIEKLTHSNYKAYYSSSVQVVSKIGNSIKELLLMELSNSLYLRKNDPDDWPVSKIYGILKNNYCRDEILDPEVIRENANRVLYLIKKKIADQMIELSPDIDLSLDDYQKLQRSVINKLGEGESKVAELKKTTSFLNFMPNNYVKRFFEQKPELFFDGVVWRKPYREIGDETIKQEIFEEFSSYLSDVVYLTVREDEEITSNFYRFKRNATSIKILEGYMVE